MKNGIFTSFICALVVVVLCFYEYLEAFFIALSEIFWAFADFDVMAVVLAVLFVALFLWFLIFFFKNRRKEELVEVVEFKSPDDMTPVEVGFLADGVVDSEDISSLFVYWAAKKYVEISGEKTSQKIVKLVDALPKTSKDYEISLFNLIFNGRKEVYVSQISGITEKSEVLPNLVRKVEKEDGQKLFNKKVLSSRQWFLCAFVLLMWITMMYFRLEYFVDLVAIVETFTILACVAIVLCSMWVLKTYDYRHKKKKKVSRILSLCVTAVVFVALAALIPFFYLDRASDWYMVIFLWLVLALILVVLFLSTKLQIYSKEGWDKLGKVMGFKNFLETAEKDRIVALVNENPNVFYEILPYAYVLGVSDKWIKNLDVVKVELPENKKLTQTVAVCVVWNAFFASSSMLNLFHFSRLGGFVNLGKGGGGHHGGGGGPRGGGPRGGNFGGMRRR